MAEKLAIFPELPTITRIVKENEATWTIVPTGCGKSIGIPYALIRDIRNKVSNGTNGTSSKLRIFCTQPTIPAVLGLHSYQSKLSPNHKIGWAAEGTKKYNKGTQCIYATAGHVRKIMLCYFEHGRAKNITFTDILMIDEIHTGSKDNSVIIDLWKVAKKQGVKVPKLILSTATDNGMEELMEELEDIGGKVFRSTFRHFKVENKFHHKNFNKPDQDDVFEDAAKVAIELLVEKKGHGIIFCSGSAEVEDMVYMIEEKIKNNKLRETVFEGKNVRVLPCFSQCKREEIMDAISEAKKDEIKIVCATNVAESSLTIPDIIWVVDMMSEKRSGIMGGRFHLGVTWISKNSAKQREGRTGRTLKGSVCYKMCTMEQYDKFEAFRPAEILRSPISDVIIELLNCGLDPTKVITELSKERLEGAKKTLVDCGCIIINDIKNIDNKFDEEFPVLGSYNKNSVEDMCLVAKVTDVGHFVSKIPMSVRNAAALFFYIFGNEEYRIEPSMDDENIFWTLAVITMADLFGPNFFWFPRKKKNEDKFTYHDRLGDHAEEYFMKFEGSSPLHSLMNAFLDCMQCQKYNINTKPYKMTKWSRENSVNNKKLKEICAALRRHVKILLHNNISCSFEMIDEEHLEKIFPKINRCLEAAYNGTIIKKMCGKCYGPDGRIVVIDTLKTIGGSEYSQKFIPISQIQFNNTFSHKTVMISLWIPLSRSEEEIELEDRNGIGDYIAAMKEIGYNSMGEFDDSDSW